MKLRRSLRSAPGPARNSRPRPNRRVPPSFLTGAALLVLGLGGCVSVSNYTDPAGPRFAPAIQPHQPPEATAPAAWVDGGLGDEARASAPLIRTSATRTMTSGRPAVTSAPLTLEIASFNIQEGREIAGALDVMKAHPVLSGADFVLLQEMDSEGTERIAQALGMSWVYYPASLRDGRDFGNAVLSRWPLLEDQKLILPHEAWIGGTRRTATAVTALVGDVPVRVYSVHLATPLNQSRGDREDQFQAVLADAAQYDHVIIGGDLNSGSMPELAVEADYLWPTESGPRTVWFSRVDHILYRGLVPTWFAASGTVEENRGTSDHLPVWARGRIR